MKKYLSIGVIYIALLYVFIYLDSAAHPSCKFIWYGANPNCSRHDAVPLLSWWPWNGQLIFMLYLVNTLCIAVANVLAGCFYGNKYVFFCYVYSIINSLISSYIHGN